MIIYKSIARSFQCWATIKYPLASRCNEHRDSRGKVTYTEVTMTNLSVFAFDSKDVRIVIKEGNPWFVAKDICRILEVKNVSEALTRLDEDEKGITPTDTSGGKQQMAIISQSGLKRLISTSRKPYAPLLAKQLGIEVMTTCAEAESLLVVQNAFKHLNPIPHFFINGFIVDLYFPSHRIAIECDEHGHSRYDETKDQERQDAITKALGCRWVRFNPHSKTFCVGNVINKIMKMIY